MTTKWFFWCLICGEHHLKRQDEPPHACSKTPESITKEQEKELITFASNDKISEEVIAAYIDSMKNLFH